MKPGEKLQWQARPSVWAKYTFDDMMNASCKYHSGIGKPASHTTRECIWTKQLMGTAGLPPPPGPPPSPRPGPPPPA